MAKGPDTYSPLSECAGPATPGGGKSEEDVRDCRPITMTMREQQRRSRRRRAKHQRERRDVEIYDMLKTITHLFNMTLSQMRVHAFGQRCAVASARGVARESVRATGRCVHTSRGTHSSCHCVGTTPVYNKRRKNH